ncbi:MarC family protein [Caldiplasma sukawensis]
MNLILALEYFSYVASAMFAIINPIGAIPTLVSLTQDYSDVERKRTIRMAIMMEAGMLFGFVFVGIYVFQILGININDFKVAGGILLFKVAFDMLQGRPSNTKLTKEESMESTERETIGIVPIGTPLLAGPGSITTAIILNTRAIGISEKMGFYSGILLVLLLSFIILHYSFALSKKLGRTGTTVISRIMGLLLASIGVELISTGIIAIVQSI